MLVSLFATVSEDAVIASSATLRNAATPGNKSLRRSLHNHDLSRSKELGKMTICSPARHRHFKTLPYPCHLIAADDIEKALRHLLMSGFYA